MEMKRSLFLISNYTELAAPIQHTIKINVMWLNILLVLFLLHTCQSGEVDVGESTLKAIQILARICR